MFVNEQRYDPGAKRSSTLARDLRTLLGTLKRRLREQAHSGDLTPAQASILLRLERGGPATVTGLARAEGIRPQSVGATIAVLEAAGHVAGMPDPTDGRQTLLSLTPACRAWITAGRAAREDWLSRAIARELDTAEQEQLAAAIALLNRIAAS